MRSVIVRTTGSRSLSQFASVSWDLSPSFATSWRERQHCKPRHTQPCQAAGANSIASMPPPHLFYSGGGSLLGQMLAQHIVRPKHVPEARVDDPVNDAIHTQQEAQQHEKAAGHAPLPRTNSVSSRSCRSGMSPGRA